MKTNRTSDQIGSQEKSGKEFLGVIGLERNFLEKIV